MSPSEDTQFKKGNLASLKHGAGSERVALPPDLQAVVDNWKSSVLNYKHIDPNRDMALVMVAANKLKKLLKYFALEDANPDTITFKHDTYIISLENSFRLDLERLCLTPLTHRQIMLLLDKQKELGVIEEVNFNEG
jgi:hypothetical protein